MIADASNLASVTVSLLFKPWGFLMEFFDLEMRKAWIEESKFEASTGINEKTT